MYFSRRTASYLGAEEPVLLGSPAMMSATLMQVSGLQVARSAMCQQEVQYVANPLKSCTDAAVVYGVAFPAMTYRG